VRTWLQTPGGGLYSEPAGREDQEIRSGGWETCMVAKLQGTGSHHLGKCP
jgi:hypothetical protein